MTARPAAISPVGVHAQGLACAAGVGLPALAALLRGGGSALVSSNGFMGTPLNWRLGCKSPA